LAPEQGDAVSSGTNRFIVTHNPNITAAFPKIGVPVADGEALVFGPGGKGGATIVARIKIEEWPSLRPYAVTPSLISLWQYHRKYGILMWHSHRSA
jgi:hypothetical protein